MSETIEANGSCLCQRVKVSAKRMSKNFGACHCSMCKTWGGGPLLASDCGTEVSFEGQDNISVYNSSDWAERGFCKHCGTHLFYKLKEKSVYHMPLGLFVLPEEMQFESQIFIENKPGYYEFSNATKNMTGEEAFAAYAPSD